MMYTAEQILQGLINYIDNEVLAALDTKGKILMGTGISLAMQKADSIIKSIPQNEIVKMFRLVDENGMYDVDTVAVQLKANMEKYGKMQFKLPVVGTLIFTPEDVVLLQKYIKGEK